MVAGPLSIVDDHGPVPGAMPEGPPVALVSMPTLSGRFPSFQLGLLAPTLERAGIECQPFSMFMYFGTHIGWRLNEALAEVWPCMVGEWIWAKAAFGPEPPSGASWEEADRAYHARFRNNFAAIERKAGASFDDIRRVRDEKVEAFLDWCVDSVDWSRFGLVGLSCVFQQNLATLAFSRRLKERYPELPIILGGGGFEDDIAEEIFRECPWIDLIHCGDADRSFPEVVRRMRAGESMEGLVGVMWRGDEGPRFEGRAPNLTELDTTPVPAFDEYFHARNQGGYLGYAGQDQVMLPIETARGCWWGMSHHCTFCGLNRQGMDFRARSVESTLDMVRELADKYGQRTFDAIDNIISRDYIDGLFSRLAEERMDLRFHYEVRPTLTRPQLKKMKEGGLYSVQPGVESLNTHVLKLMDKRTTGMRNLEFIKWCTYYGIHNLYNILLRFSGEQPDDYLEQVDTIARIPHYQPPKFITKVRADRGSPMYTRPEEHGVTELRAAACYPFLYPAERFDLKRVAYYFDHDMHGTVDDSVYEPLFVAVERWQARWDERPRPALTYTKLGGTLKVEDTRGAHPQRYTLGGLVARVHEGLRDARRLQTLAQDLEEDEATLQGAIDELVEKDLVIHLDKRYLALALPTNKHH